MGAGRGARGRTPEAASALDHSQLSSDYWNGPVPPPEAIPGRQGRAVEDLPRSVAIPTRNHEARLRVNPLLDDLFRAKSGSRSEANDFPIFTLAGLAYIHKPCILFPPMHITCCVQICLGELTFVSFNKNICML